MASLAEHPMRQKVHSLARQAQLASARGDRLEIPPDMTSVLADYLRETLATVDDQAWFWTDEWQAGEREAEADLAAGRVQAEEDRLRLKIEDRGVGFDVESMFAAQATVGLAGMRERAALLGGSLTVESKPGEGTRVEGEVPVRET